MRKIRRWLELSWRERMLLARAVVYLVIAKLERPTTSYTVLRRPRFDAARLAWAVYIASRNVPFQTTCLDRALALFRLSRAEGLAAELRIGVRTSDGALEAHAWVEHDGVVLLDEEASRFVAFDAPILISK